MFNVPETLRVSNANVLKRRLCRLRLNDSGHRRLVRTYGVGELSALNGIAGSYAEDVDRTEVSAVVRSVAQRRMFIDLPRGCSWLSC